MLVHSGITPGSYIKANSTKIYTSAILILIRPMTKLCLSDLFSISLAEFYSSDKLKLNSSLIFNSISNFNTSICALMIWISIALISRTSHNSEETKECKVVKKSIKMAVQVRKVSQQLILPVAVAAVQSHCPVIHPLFPCPHPLMGDTDG